MSIASPVLAGDTVRARRRWELFDQPKSGVAYLVAIELAGLVVGVMALTLGAHTWSAAGQAILLAGLCVGYAELARRVERLRDYLHLGRTYHIGTDPTSVWTFGAALLLPTGYAVGVTIVVFAHILLVGHGDKSIKPYRVVFGAASTLAGVLAAEAVRGARPGLLGGGAGAALSTGGALLAYTGASLATVVIGMRLLTGGGWRRLLPVRSDVAFELATLLLGLFTAELLLHLPWAAPVVLVLVGVLHRATLVDELQAAAQTDPKTGLLNCGAWQELAQRQAQRAARSAQPFAVLMLDLDQFKAINDQHGHPVGDRVLRAVADRLRQELRDYDAVGRFGGEEFVALLDDVTESTALEVAERLRSGVARLQSELGFAVTTSIGVASGPVHGTEVEKLVKAADAALYLAKGSGRDCVRSASALITRDRDPR